MSIRNEGEPMPETSREARVLDLVHLARQTFGDRELERELLGLFEGQCRRLLPVLARGGPEADRVHAAHTLKGAARAVGAWRLAALADEFERALEGKAPDALDSLVGKLEGAVRETQAAVALGRAA
jgi:HPt (histidine-containing phosphotransfer) domain-containing protein